MRPADPPERIRTLLTLYRECHYDIELPGGTSTLRVGQTAPAAIDAWIGDAAQACFVSAANPHSQALSPPHNLRRMAQLEAALDRLEARRVPAAGRVPGERWREQALFVCGPDLGAIDALMRHYEQNACVVVAPGRAARLRLYREDWRPHVTMTADLDWAR